MYQGELNQRRQPGLAGRFRRSLFGIKPSETSFEVRGFLLPVPHVRERLERVVGAFDRGLGRGRWFICGASPDRLREMIAGFPETRHGDLWSGVGLACAYAGGVDESTLRAVQRLAGPHRFAMGQGTAFAAKARE